MDWGEVDERMAAARLQAALEAHILASEQPPPEVTEAVCEMYEGRGRNAT